MGGVGLSVALYAGLVALAMHATISIKWRTRLDADSRQASASILPADSIPWLLRFVLEDRFVSDVHMRFLGRRNGLVAPADVTIRRCFGGLGS